LINFLSLYLFPLISGERALPLSLLKIATKNPLFKNNSLEVVINEYCIRNGIPIEKRIIPGLTQTPKYVKWKRGFYLLFKQSIEIALTIIFLKLQRKSVFS